MIKDDNIASFLKKIPLFSSLTDRELQDINKKLVIRDYVKNETILHEEDTNQFMYIILSGKVKVIKTTGEGKEVILAMHQSGDFFGEVSLINGKTTPASVVAMDDSRIAIISKKEFYSIIFSQHKVLQNLLEILSLRLRTAWDTIKLLTFNNATQRLRMLFFMLAEEHGMETDGGVMLNVRLSHQEMADMTGMTRETVTRVIDKWQRDGEITILENKIIRLNPSFKKRQLIS
ncbi:MAG: Crp/Fnr family transcriptional regulator [Thermodesulfovibrionia bacterium]